MRYAKLAVALIIISSLILWCRRSVDFGHIARSLPFSGGHRPGIYDVGTIVVILLALWGLSRLRGTGKPSKEAEDLNDGDLYEDFDDEYEPDEDDEDEDG